MNWNKKEKEKVIHFLSQLLKCKLNAEKTFTKSLHPSISPKLGYQRVLLLKECSALVLRNLLRLAPQSNLLLNRKIQSLETPSQPDSQKELNYFLHLLWLEWIVLMKINRLHLTSLMIVHKMTNIKRMFLSKINSWKKGKERNKIRNCWRERNRQHHKK